MKKGRVLVTGGAGFIGSHTSVELVQAGYEVIIVDNLCNSNPEMIDGIKKIVQQEVIFEKEDCCDEDAMRRVFNKYQFDAVIHFAAYKAVGESVEEPLKYFRNNFDSLLVVMSMMREFNVPNLLFSSSCTVYGQPDTLPVTEQTPRKEAESPYGYTKQASEDMIEQCVKAYPNFKGIALRYFNPIGAHPSAEIGELPKGVPSNLIPYITQTAIGLRKELSIYGNDYNTPDGTAIRDYIDVVDLAQGHVAAVERMIEQRQTSNYEVFNVGTGKGLSVLELVKEFERVNSLTLPYKIVGRRAGDIMQIWADTSYANKELGWKASRTISQTLSTAWKWQNKLQNQAK